MLLLWKFCTKITRLKKEHTCKLTNKGMCKKKERRETAFSIFSSGVVSQFTQVVYTVMMQMQQGLLEI